MKNREGLRLTASHAPSPVWFVNGADQNVEVLRRFFDPVGGVTVVEDDERSRVKVRCAGSGGSSLFDAGQAL